MARREITEIRPRFGPPSPRLVYVSGGSVSRWILVVGAALSIAATPCGAQEIAAGVPPASSERAPAATALAAPAETRALLAAPPAARPRGSTPTAAVIVAGGIAAACLGVGLGFGVSANDIDHRAGVSFSQSGVDLGLTRATAVAGQRDAAVANGLFVGAGVAALVALAFVAFWPASSR